MATTQIRGNTQIQSGTIYDAQIASAAAISTSKLQDAANFILRGGSVAFTADQSLGGNKLTNVGTPSSGTDAANKSYVDSVVSGLDVKSSVRSATTTNITLSGTQTVDGVVLIAGDRVLVKDQSDTTQNGIYVVASGSWTRATDADSSAEVTPGMFTFVEEGTTNADTGWTLTTNGTITVGSTGLAFSQFSSSASVSGGAGLTKTGSVLDVGAGDGIQVDTDSVTIKLDSTTLSKSASGLKVASAGITATELATSVAGNGLSGGGGTALAVNVASAGGIEIVSDNLQVKLDGSSFLSSSNGVKVNPAKFIVRETPTGTINGSNTVFTLANTPIAGKEEVFLNGILQDDGGNDYTISGTTITFVSAPISGDKIRVTYLIA